MLVKCIKKGCYNISYGKEYEVVGFDSDGDIFIINDKNKKELYFLRNFKVIEESIEDVIDNSAINEEAHVSEIEEINTNVKCINNENIKNKLTINKTYEVLQKKERCYFVIDDLGNETGFASERFEKVDKNEEKVNHPNHYNKGIETIDYIESWNMNFNVGNVIKYTTRSGYKENALEDLLKAKWYIEREIEKIRK